MNNNLEEIFKDNFVNNWRFYDFELRLQVKKLRS